MQTVVRCLVAVLLPALAALGLASVSTQSLGEGPLGSAVALAAAGLGIGTRTFRRQNA